MCVKRVLTLVMTVLIICSAGTQAFAGTEIPEPVKTLNFATLDAKPLAIDRLIYEAFKDIGYQVSFTPNSAQTGYERAQRGENDGVISFYPNLEEKYNNLIRVPKVLDEVGIYAYVPNNSTLVIDSWNALSGLRVGVLSQHTYLNDRLPQAAAVLYKDDANQLMEGLLNGEYDAAIYALHTYETFYYESSVKTAGPLVTLTEYLYINKKHSPLLASISSSIARMRTAGRIDQILSYSTVQNTDQKRTVLHILSSSTAVSREDQFCSSLYTFFEDDISIEWYTLSLDVKRFPDNANRYNYFSRLLREDFLTRDLAAIIVSGDEAMRFLEKNYLLLFKNTPILFYGMDHHFDTAYDFLRPYMTGIVTQLSAFDTVSAALTLFPATRTVFVVNDFTMEGQSYQSLIREQLAPFMDRLSVVYNDSVDFKTLLAQIRDLPSDSIVLMGSYFADANGQYYSQAELKRYLLRDCDVPYFSVYATSFAYGGLGGKAPDYSLYADTIKDMLLRILSGSPVDSQPILFDSTRLNQWVFDNPTMLRFNIRRDQLPEDAIIINAIPTIWETDPLLIYGGITAFTIVLFALIALFFLQLRLRRKNKDLLEMQNSLEIAQELLAKEAKLAEVKDRLERTINTAPVAYVMTVGDTIVETNDFMKQQVGMEIGNAIASYYTFPEQLKNIVAELQNFHAGSNVVVSLNMADGRVHRFLANFAATEYNGEQAYMLWVVDIEESERQKDRLNNSQRNLQTILNTLPVPVRVTDNDSNIVVYANRAFLHLFNASSLSEVRGKNADMFLPPQQLDGTDTQDYLRTMDLANAPQSVNIALVTLKGHIFEAELTAMNIEYQGKSSSLGIIRDLTAEKAFENILRSTAEKEKEANMLKGRFLVNMSHEIRTPMNAIIGLTEIEIRKNPKKETLEVYKKINNSAKSLLQIINDILDLSKIEANKLEIYPQEFELEETLNSAMLVATPRLDGKQVECLLKVDLDVPRYLIGDKTRLWQIIKNFLDNSAKYTDKGKITLTVTVDSQQSDNETVYVSFIVMDTGIGISNEHLQRIFIPYEQIYNDAQTRYSGTGLGMVISKQLCEMMGGELTVTSKIGTGTSIYFTLPFKRAKNRETQRQSLISPILAGKNILVVEDDVFSLEIMLTLLGCTKANYVSARSGAEALEKIFTYRDMGKMFDCVLMDYMMDGLNGLETALQINLSLSSIPKILMVTAYQKELIKRDIEDAGFFDILEKPFMPSQFISQLCAVFGYSKAVPAGNEVVRLTHYIDARVLLCEDNKINQEVAIGMLSQFGIHPEIANDGSEVLKVLDNRPVDLVLMDLHMPNLDGYETTKLLRSHLLYQNVPIVCLTADAMTEIADKCKSAGMSDYLTKPIEFSTLHNMLLKWLPVYKQAAEGKYAANGDAQIRTYPEIEGIAYAEGVARFGGIRDVYEKTLFSYAKSLPTTWPAFDEVKADPKPMMREVHQLKGISGNLGVTEVYHAAVAFEITLKMNKPNKRLYDSLIEQCERAGSTLLRVIEPPVEKSKETGDDNEWYALLTHLHEALMDYDPIACEQIIENLNAKTWPQADAYLLKEVCDLASTYEFEEALAAYIKLTSDGKGEGNE